MPNAKPELTSLLQEFVDARISAAALFARAEHLLPAGSDASLELLTWLAESDQMLRLPAGRHALAQRLREFSQEEISWEELDLWAFALEHTEELSFDRPSSAPEVALLRAVLGWIEDWQEPEARPPAERLEQLANLLLTEKNPERCLIRLEEVVSSP
jgi:hypothetical protein